jgi:hypothetical protein
LALAHTHLKTIGYLCDWLEVKKSAIFFGGSQCRDLRQFEMMKRRVTRRLYKLQRQNY